MPVLRKDILATIEAAKGGAGAKDITGFHYQVAGDGTVLKDVTICRDGSEVDLADSKRGTKA